MRFGIGNTMASLRGRLLVAIGVCVGAALLLIAFSASRLFASHVERQFHEELYVHLQELTELVETRADGTLNQIRPLSDPRFAEPRSGYYWQVTSHSGARIQSASLTAIGVNSALDETLATTAAARHAIKSGPTGRGEVYGLVRTDPQGRATLFVISADERFLIAVRDQFNWELRLLLLVFALVFAVAMWAAIRFALRPLDQLSSALSIARQDGKDVQAAAFPSEVQPLVENINGLLATTRDLVARSRVEAAQLAHKLRTPLAIIHDDAERLAELDPHWSEAMRAQIATMQSQIDWHLARVRSGADSRVTGLNTNVSEAIDPVIRALQRLYPDRIIKSDLGSGFSVTCDPSDFQEIFGNLLDNAVRHASGDVTVSLQNQSELVSIVIESEQASPLPDDLEICFDLGFSANNNSSGLGLAVARDLARRHGGNIALSVCSVHPNCTKVELTLVATA
jgi:signal transduction histidine kinase